jgi:trehalose 6-phosphate phosphatase
MTTMKYLLTRESLADLAQAARSEALLAFDFDGTLAPIMADPDLVQMRSHTAALFGQLCLLYPCAVISGRSRSDVSSRLAGAPVRYVIGNHGIEAGSEDMPTLARPIARARALLGAALAHEPGIAIEDKHFSLSLHYRNAAHRRQARSAIFEAVQTLPDGLRAVPGRMVVNIVPEGAPTKGDSLLDLQARECARRALFVGDDTTDEDAFRVGNGAGLFSVRVGWSLLSAAHYFIHEQGEIDHLLAWLIAFRQGGHAL